MPSADKQRVSLMVPVYNKHDNGYQESGQDCEGPQYGVGSRLRVAFTSGSQERNLATASQPVVALFLNMEVVYRMPL